ncbi:diaminopimelate decarboxylase [Helicobacter canis]|uniref:Diaminopimelate decarboxylase n=3 Tax=Helicobacteraceae TaxID=72293 RepID=A0A377J6P3_9HELI|nr:diaminopimelate decarboxylase [Helicobacter canis]
MTAKSHLSPERIQLLQELAHTYGTPLYVYDMEQIKRNFLSFKQAFNARKSLICYALKANSNLSVLRLLAELGSGADCVSIGEVKRALLAGIPKYKIIFSGVGKKDDEIKEALELGILFINVESFEELKRVEAIAKSLVDSALGSHSADFGDLEATADHQSSSAPKSPKNYASPTAIPRILEEEKQGGLEKSAANKKVDSSGNAQNVSEPQAAAVEMRNRGFQGAGEGIYLGDNEQARAAESTIYRSKPATAVQGEAEAGFFRNATPKPSQAESPKKARISIRVNPNIDAKTHPYISTGLHENKFGVDMESAKQMYLYAHKSAFLEPVGIHFHIGSQLTDLEPLTQAARKIADLARSLLALGVNLRFFDIGGGLGIRYEDEKPIDLYSYAQGILSTLSGCDWTIICEPGRRIVGDSGLLLTQVISQKLTESKRFVIVDAGMNDLVRPALYGAYHQPIILQNSACSDRVGFLAKNGDCGGDSALITTQGKSLESPCKAPFLAQKSCREDTTLESTCETSANSQAQSVASLEKVDSSTATTLSEPAKDSRILEKNAESVFDKKPQAAAIEMRNRGFQGAGEGIYLGDNEQARAAESTIYRSNATPKPMPKADIVGPVCESSDTFCKNIALPPLHNGALLGFSNAGAYGYSMASTYNARMRPAEVGIYADGARLIKPRESFEASVADELALLDSSK